MTPDVPGKGPVDETMRARVHAIAQEAYRRRLEQTHPGHDIDAPTVILAIEIALSGWTPPEPEPEVDPDVLAFREWLATSPWHPGSDRDEADLHPAYRPDGMLCQTYRAGARMAREQEREQANMPIGMAGALVDRCQRMMHSLPPGVRAQWDAEWGLVALCRAVEAEIAKYQGEA